MAFSRVKRKLFPERFLVFISRNVPQREMPAAGWRTLFLLLLLPVYCCGEEECVLGLVGRPVSLPCFLPQLLTSVNLSIAWRRGEEVVLWSVWREVGEVEEWSVSRFSTPEDASLSGNFSLQLHSVAASENNTHFSLVETSGGNSSSELCSVCLQTAASFSTPLLQREESKHGGGEAVFSCESSGGFPAPTLSWLINNKEDPPPGAVTTITTPLPDTQLFNISSRLTVNLSKGGGVTCIVENPKLNETLSSSSDSVSRSAVQIRASEAMWIFSTALCVVVGVMVLMGVAYQIHLDRIHKRKKHDFQKLQSRGYKRRSPDKEEEEEEKEAMKPEEEEEEKEAMKPEKESEV
ncbi:ICOS ligand-like isoform X2 [Trematomus bernacchii]|uniref:ICOS ligand-like isoform X2 n=1 Tax=Trematomus bernacchii TaxID=40690 RepID=UPI00146DCA66|nr:ICOS ligand-like isoform X2 [Trematomus bernacchii]